MANYDKRFTVRISHANRMALGILADAEGSKISVYVRRLIERFIDTMDTRLPTEHDPAVWERVADAMDQEGPDAFLTIRVTNDTMEALNDVAVYSVSSQVQTIIKAHIYRNMPSKKRKSTMTGIDFIANIVRMIRKLTEV